VPSEPLTPPRRSLPLALAGLVLGVVGVVGYFVFVIYLGPLFPGARNNALPSWLIVAAGLALSGLAVARANRRLLAGVLLVLNVAVAGLFASMIYVSFRVPPAQGPKVGAPSADFALADQTGTTVQLADFKGKPLLLVFYRGHW